MLGKLTVPSLFCQFFNKHAMEAGSMERDEENPPPSPLNASNDPLNEDVDDQETQTHVSNWQLPPPDGPAPNVPLRAGGCGPRLCCFLFFYFLVALVWHHLDNAFLSLVFFSASAFLSHSNLIGGILIVAAVVFFILAYVKSYVKETKNPETSTARYFLKRKKRKMRRKKRKGNLCPPVNLYSYACVSPKSLLPNRLSFGASVYAPGPHQQASLTQPLSLHSSTLPKS